MCTPSIPFLATFIQYPHDSTQLHPIIISNRVGSVLSLCDNIPPPLVHSAHGYLRVPQHDSSMNFSWDREYACA